MTLQCFKVLSSVFLPWISPADGRKRLMLSSLAVEACMAREQGPGKNCVCHRVFPFPLSETASEQRITSGKLHNYMKIGLRNCAPHVPPSSVL